ncbi:FAD-binding domain-containing protein [Apiospora marii]|uniref:FAD-binding domain-containing protein n=1 Tax=Apiospora marii TaxID=335849 RepID=A0ABR1RIY8_9PEZI
MRLFPQLLLSLTWLVTRSQGAAVADPSSKQDLNKTFSSQNVAWSHPDILSFPGSEEFTNATWRWDVYSPPTYRAAITPLSEDDVVNAVKMATKFKIPFLATGGRHGHTTTLANLKNGLAIDLSQLKDVKVDKKAGTLTIGPGVLFADIFDPVYEAGYQITTGSCSCVGMTGAGLGAGVGRLQGLEGLMIDAVQSVRIVTADGKVLEASEESNADLFWGIRGAGANFGVIVSTTFKLQPLYNDGVWTTADLIFPGDRNVSYFDLLDKLHPLPPQLTIETIMSYNSTLKQVSHIHHMPSTKNTSSDVVINHKPQLMVSVVYAGYQEETLEVMKPILSLHPTYQTIKEITWNRMSYESSFGLDQPSWCVNGNLYANYGVNLRNNSVATWRENYDKLAKFWADTPEAQSSVVVFETWSIQGTVAIPDDRTAYPWRDATTYVMLQMRWDPQSPNAAAVSAAATEMARELRSKYAATSGYGGLTVYINYAIGDEKIEEVYGRAKLPRLAGLKKKYDPDNVFGFNTPLPTEYP